VWEWIEAGSYACSSAIASRGAGLLSLAVRPGHHTQRLRGSQSLTEVRVSDLWRNRASLAFQNTEDLFPRHRQCGDAVLEVLLWDRSVNTQALAASPERARKVHCSPRLSCHHHCSSAPSTRCSIPSAQRRHDGITSDMTL
jgi:hypothetical protein